MTTQTETAVTLTPAQKRFRLIQAETAFQHANAAKKRGDWIQEARWALEAEKLMDEAR